MIRLFDGAARLATLVLPLFIMHGRGIADGLISAVAILFLARSLLARDWAWLGSTWLRIGLVWWAWLSICSLPVHGLGISGPTQFLQALATLRFLLFVAALEHTVLADTETRRWLARVLTVATLYIAVQSLWQFATGRNFFGHGRFVDGELTGPFDKPRAAAPLSRLLPPVLLPPLARLVESPRLLHRLAGGALLVGAIGTVVLIGQRMPLLLTIFGLLVAGLLMPRLRRTVLIACVAAALLIGASALVSPPTFHRLVVKFSAQMEGFWASDYGLLAARARAIVIAHPFTGRGFDGFRDACADPQYFHGWHWPSDPTDRGGGLAGCNIHPHNFYLEAATSGGLPGLALFTALVMAWLVRLWPGIGAGGDPLRIGLFVSTLMHFWPIASSSSLTAIELGGFSFVLLGWGLTEAGGPGRSAPSAGGASGKAMTRR